MRVLFRIFLFISFINTFAIASPISDSLELYLQTAKGVARVEALNKLVPNYWYDNPGKSYQIADEAYNLAVKYNLTDEKGKALTNKGVIFLLVTEYDSARYYIDQSIIVFQKSHNSLRLANSYRIKADIFMDLFQYDSSLANYQKAGTIFDYIDKKENPTKEEIGMYSLFLNNISSIYSAIEKFPECIAHAFKAIKYYEKFNNRGGKAIAYLDIAIAYSNIKKTSPIYETRKDSSYKYALIALENAKGSDRMFIIPQCYAHLGMLDLFRENYKLALKNLLVADSLYVIYPNTFKNAFNKMNIARTYLSLELPDKSLPYIQDALKTAQENNMTEFKSSILYTYANYYKVKKDFKNAYETLFKLYWLDDSLALQETVKKLSEIDRKYNLEKKNRELEHLQHIAENKDSNNKILMLVVFSLIMLILIISTFIHFINKKRKLEKRTNTILSDMNEKVTQQNLELQNLNATKDKFFSIIAHDIRNPLAAINFGLQVIQSEYENLTDEELYQLLTDLKISGNNLSKLFENLLSWSKSQRGLLKFEPANVNLQFLTFDTISFTQKIAENKKINIINQIPENTICFADVNMLNTVLRNLVSNAIKYTNVGGTITINSIPDEDCFIVSITDNGVGISEDKISKLFKIDENVSTPGTNNERGTGLGLILCKEFLDKHNTDIKIESELGKGTTFSFKLPKGKISEEKSPNFLSDDLDLDALSKLII